MHNNTGSLFGGGGVYARIPLVKKLSLQPELLFSSEGTGYKKWRTDEESQRRFSSRDTLSLHYINLPVMLEYEFVKGLRGEFGPQFGFLVRAKNKWWSRYDRYGKGSENVKDSFKTFDFGLNFGLNYEARIGNGSADFGVRYNLGLTDIAENFDSEEGKVRNRVFTIGMGIGYTF